LPSDDLFLLFCFVFDVAKKKSKKKIKIGVRLKNLGQPHICFGIYIIRLLNKKEKKMIQPKRTITYMFNVLGTTCVFFHSGKWHEILFIGLHKYGGMSLFFISNILSKWEIKKWKFEKSDFGDFQLLEVRGKKGLKIVRFVYVVFIV